MNDQWVCNDCNIVNPSLYNYCPYCGSQKNIVSFVKQSDNMRAYKTIIEIKDIIKPGQHIMRKTIFLVRAAIQRFEDKA